jgi:GT2 family glycosyltransferase
MKVSVVIPNYNTWDLVKKNTDALLLYDDSLIHEIIVVDDCSPIENYLTFSDKIFIIRNRKNLGYGGSVNVGMKAAIGDCIILLDSDACILKPIVEQLVSFYAADELIGCIGFSTVDEKGEDTGNFQFEPSVYSLIAGQFITSKIGFLRFWRSRNKLPFSCAVSFRKRCLEDLGYFDEKMFPILDADNDFSMKVHRSAWKLIFSKEIVVFHKGGNSYKRNYQRVLLFHESRWKLLKKYNLIPNEFLIKKLIQLRILIELLILKVHSFYNTVSKEKGYGRKILLKEVNNYH